MPRKMGDEGGFLTFILGELFTDAWKGYKGATTSQGTAFGWKTNLEIPNIQNNFLAKYPLYF